MTPESTPNPAPAEGFLKLPPDARPLTPGEGLVGIGRFDADQFRCALAAAARVLPDREVREVVREHFPEARELPWPRFLSSLGSSTSVPQGPCFAVLSDFNRRGFDLRDAAHALLGNSFCYFYLQTELVIASAFADQPFSLRPLDFVSCAYLAHPGYEGYVSNSILIDARLESARGRNREARVSYVQFDPAGLNHAAYEYFRHALRIIPLGLKEPVAEVESAPGGVDAVWQDRFGKTVPLRRRPSLRRIAEAVGFALEEKEGVGSFAGRPVAVAEPPRNRAIPRGIYRALADVAPSPRGPLVNYQGLPDVALDRLHLARGFRYHLDLDLFPFEYQVRYCVLPARHLAMLLAVKIMKAGWPIVSGLRQKDPWTYLREFNELNVPVAGSQTPVVFNRPEPTAPERNGLAERVLEFAERHGLSPRETQILHLVIEGKPNREIADGCFISEATVKTHLSRIMRKTGAKSRSGLIAHFLS